MVKTISRLISTYVVLFKEVLPQVISDDNPYGEIHVSVGKLGDVSDRVAVPSIYVTRGQVSIEYLAINNMASFQLMNWKKRHVALLTVPIVVEVIEGTYGGCENLIGTCMKVIMASKPYIEREFKVHFTGNPSAGAPEIVEQGAKVFKGMIQFPVQKEVIWEHAPIGPLIEDILVKLKENQ